MGQFSWLYSDTGKQMLDGVSKKSYLLVPPKFQDKYGKYIVEECYDGYGDMGGYDVYDLVAEWNREYIPTLIKRIKAEDTYTTPCHSTDAFQYYYDNGVPPQGIELRSLGIDMACYDEDNIKMKYPIKITENPMEYDDVKPSESDPNQGWYYEEEDEDDYDYEDEENYYYYVEELESLDLDDTAYDYYYEALGDVRYGDTSRYTCYYDVIEDARHTAEINEEDED